MKTYIFGHKKPDTDSVCSAISYSYLKNKLGLDTVPKVLGDLNKETKFVLNYFNVPEPKYLDNVKVQIKNMNYIKNAYIDEYASVNDTFNKMHDLSVTGLPISHNGYLNSYVNLKDISKYIIDGDIYNLDTSYNNIIKCLEGKEVLKFDEEIKGKILVAAYKSKTFIESISLDNDDILIVGNRREILEYALNSKIKLLIIDGDNNIPDDLLKIAEKNKVNIISTPFNTYLTSNKIKLCNYIKCINATKDPISFTLSDFRDDFLDIANKYGHTNYPIVTIDNKCVGMLRLINQNNYDKCKCILVDHNQGIQSVDGIEEAEIMEVIDHHNLGVIGTTKPISFRTMPVGCTATIIYHIYEENNIEIPKDIAGIMLSSILSDTVILKSPTTTQLDIEVANKLAKITNIDIYDYGYEMFKAGTSIKGMTPKEILEQDFKTYKLDNINFGISQVMTLDIDEILNQKEEYIKLLDDMSKNYNYKVALMFVTDIINNGSYIIYNNQSKDIVEVVYGIKEVNQGYFIEDMISRKKQMVPDLMEYLQR